ncbi:MAG TPA: MurR/RpiR family transcriptional regulator [Terriglobia bacterium]|nr:MurR/RpiR family transcriptional regulator [Terriglobia bacterium]
MMAETAGSCLARLRAGRQREPKAVAKIRRFIQKSPFRARNLSIGELGRACGTSAATVYRLCRDLGYSGYKEFQLDLAASLARQDPVSLEDLSEGASPAAIVHKVFEYHRQSLIDTERLLDIRQLTRIAKLIQRSRRVLLLGFGGSGSSARRAADALLNLGYTAIAVTDPFSQIFATENTGPSDVVIGISHTGQTAMIIEAIQTARRRGARTVALTNYPRSPLALASEFRLITAFHEHRINAAVSSSVTAQLCVLASLYFILGSWGGKKSERLANDAEQRAQATLRSPKPQKRK